MNNDIDKQEKLDATFINIATELANLSKCVSHHVGCVIVKDGRIVSTGYNGTPSGYIECHQVHETCKDGHREWSAQYEIHAEMNAILFAARNGVSVQGSTLYSTLQPCWQCSKNIIQSGVKTIIYKEKYGRLLEQQEEINNFLQSNQVVIKQLRKPV